MEAASSAISEFFAFHLGCIRVHIPARRPTPGRASISLQINFTAMWKGRFSQDTSSLVQQFGESISYDWRLFSHDIAGSIAHARAQSVAGLLTADEFSEIESGLRAIEADIVAGKFEFRTSLEDIHMNIEAELTRRIGAAGAKLHTARSRNDQVATDTRLYCRTEIDGLLDGITGLQKALLDRAQKYAATVIPGYTHLQRGQPVTAGHHFLAYVEMLERDKSRLSDCRKRLNISPLGSGALAGSTINLDRHAIAAELGFDGVSQNSMDAIADRDYIAEFLFVISWCGVHLSRLSEDLILWCSAEFAFATLSDAHTTGSSLMPQKKNPDVCELTRGKTGRLVGNLMNLLVAVKGLPLTYNRDLQEDKPPLFDSVDTLRLILAVNTEMITAMELREENCRLAAADPMLLATDLADYLVKKGIPFRHAHELVGKAVAAAIATATPLDQLDLSAIDPAYGPDAKDVFSLETALAARSNPGAPSILNVRAQIAKWGATL
jgi:argininosuccinate lyase